MKRYSYYLLISWFLIVSCSEKKHGELLEIPVDLGQFTASQLLLSEITEKITSIELELTDESLLKPQRGYLVRIIINDDLVIVAQTEKIFVFDRNGKFIRSIGSIGQGPGEYVRIRNIAFDESNKCLFLSASPYKIICFDLNGNLVKESSMIQKDKSENDIQDIIYINNEFWILVYSFANEDENGLYNQSVLYRLNSELQITDTCMIRKIYERPKFTVSHKDYILYSDPKVYLFYPYEFVPTPQNKANPGYMQRVNKTVLRDTLYRFENNQLIPDLKLKFKHDGIGGDGYLFILLSNVFRSSRYVFAEYLNYLLDYDDFYALFSFCYDTKTGKGYNIRDGFTDDIHQIENIKIRPFHSNPEMFYYWHTHMDPNDLEEPNPTLYIGKLKK